ncbi:DsbA family protein [Actinomycetota bacterium Odt1-20B]
MRDDSLQEQQTGRGAWLAAEMARIDARQRRRRVFLVAAGVAGALGLGLLTLAYGGKGGDDTEQEAGTSATQQISPPGGAAGKDGSLIPVGSPKAPATLTVWEDFRCSPCGDFNKTYRNVLHELENSGQLKTEYHLTSRTDAGQEARGALRAANAAACAQDAGQFTPYHDILFANQPAEAAGAAYDNPQLLRFAGMVTGLTNDKFTRCVNEGAHNGWVTKSNEAPAHGSSATGLTVLLNGEPVHPARAGEPMTPDSLRQWVTEAGRRAGGAH